MNDRLNLSFHGAARTVTGSKHLLTVGDSRVLLDAGLFQGLKKLRERNWQDSAFDPRSVDQVLISHTHIDHVGYLPRLVKKGLRAPVHFTPAAYELAELMLLDSAKIQEEQAAYAKKKGFSKHRPPLPLYTTEDAEKALELRQQHPFNTWFPVIDGKIRARYHNSGHLLGAAFIELEIATAGDPLRLVFSGDIGRFDLPLHPDPQPLPSCDVLIMESTYGNRTHTTTPVLDQIQEPLKRTLSRGGTVLIPAFAVGRSQQITLMLRRLMRDGHIPDVPIHIDSPMAINATKIYSQFLNEQNIDRDVFEDGRLQLFPDHVHFHKTVNESKELNRMKGPRIVVSASGMLSAGRVLHHLARLAPKKENLLLLVGYQAEGTRGRKLLERAREVKIHGAWVPVRCEVISVHGLSGHADRDELLQWVDSAPQKPRQIFLVHGEPKASEPLAALLHERFGCEVEIPDLGDSFDIPLSGRPVDGKKRAASSAAERAQREPKTKPSRTRHEPLPVYEPKAAVEDPLAPGHIDAIMKHPAYRRTDLDLEFIQRPDLRSLRLQLEYLKPQILMIEEGVQSTIVVFGGTRILEPEAAGHKVEEAQKAVAANPNDRKAKRRLQVAERIAAKSHYYNVAREFGRMVGRAGDGPDDHRLMVVTGGGPGIMEAGNRGSFDVGARSIGLNITLSHEQFPNPYITPDLCFQFRYFALRKMHFMLRARALVAFPGGYGTLDELFEALCLIQTRTIDPLPVVLVGEDFWRGTFDVDFLAAEGTISPEDVDLFWYAETAEEIWDGIVAWYDSAGRSMFEDPRKKK